MNRYASILIVAAAICAAAPGRAADEAPSVYRGHGLALHGDLKYPAGFRHFDYVNPNAPKGGTLRISSEGGFDSLHGYIIRGDPERYLSLISETLMIGSDDEPFSMYGLLAESVELPDDRSWITFHLRPEARWHDGQPVTAEDVAFSFNILREKGAPGFASYYIAVDRVEALDPRTVRFVFKPGAGRENRELPLIMGQIPVLCAHFWKDRDFSRPLREPPMGSGPYRIKQFQTNRFIEYERVPDYWGRHLAVNAGMYNFDVIHIEYFRDAVVELEAFKAGQVDWRMETSAKNWATQYDFPAVRDGRVKCERVPNHRPSNMQGIVFNLRRPLFQDRRLRRALSLAFDFEWINRKLFYGSYQRSRSYFDNLEIEPRGPPGPDELPILRALREKYPAHVPEEVFTAEYQPPTTGAWQTEREHRRAVRENLLKADALLREAGWRLNPGTQVMENPGLPDPQGRPARLEMEILVASPGQERFVLPYARTLRRLGVIMRVRTLDASLYQNRVLDFDFDVMLGFWYGSKSPGNEQPGNWGSKAAGESGSFNMGGIRNPALDELLAQMVAAPDRAALVTRARAMDRVLMANEYFIPMWYLPYDRIAHWNKFGRPEITGDSGAANWLTWWYKADSPSRGK